ncbi:MAG: acetamidase/formamidase family protein [Coriobacteriia bacterium]|nr:acetamidase/formamidase family protein [Coriobacteriia bacterium]MCL2536899.1 acetamidase/formamidase family protein [Coriobacteriia bacterium]
MSTVFVNKFTNGILDPKAEMLGPVKSGGRIVAHTAPGCWGPMLTPELKGGHEVTVPVYVEGAQPGDAVALTIESIVVTSASSTSGTDTAVEGRFNADPYVARVCPSCETQSPSTKVDGIGVDAIVCADCNAPIAPFEVAHGYTMVFDNERTMGLTVGPTVTAALAASAHEVMDIPAESIQNPSVLLNTSDLQGVVTRMRPFLGQLGTTPSIPFPDSHNAGDFGTFLVGAPHEYAISQEDLEHRTDGHMDINKVRAGATLVCPVKVEGAGVYLGDAHAMQSDGEIAGHTTDVAAITVLRVDLIKDLEIDGPVLLQTAEDLPYLAKPLSMDELDKAVAMLQATGVTDEAMLEDSMPIAFVGTGANLNCAIDNAMERASKLLNISFDEVRNRVTISGGIDIGRAPGTVTVTLRVPLEKVTNDELADMIMAKYS